MLIETHRARLPVSAGQGALLRSALNARLTAVSGVAWITLDGDRRDIVLEPGQSFVVDSDRPVMIYALNASQSLELSVDGAAGVS
jgi:hypothetical protein